MTVATRQYQPSQDGFSIAGTFIADTDGMAVTSTVPFNSEIGLVFDYGLRLDSMGRPLVPPIVVGLAVQLTTHNLVGGDPGAELLELWVVPEFTPGDFNNTDRPFTRSEMLVAGTGAVWTGVPSVVTFTLGLYVQPTNPLTPTCMTTWTGLRTQLLASPYWTGRLAFSVRGTTGPTWIFTTVESTGQTGPQLLSTQSAFHTGHNLGGVQRGRARHCARSGLPANTAALTEDGFVVGMHVLPDWQEPEDRVGLDIVIPSTEGEVDDKVTGDS